MSIKPVDLPLLKSVLQDYTSKDAQTLPSVSDSSTDGTQYLGLPTNYDGGYKHYFGLESKALRKKFIQLSFTTLITQTLASTVVIIYELFHAITFCCTLNRRFSSLGERFLSSGCLLLHIITIPLAIIGMQLAAVYGIANPEGGRKHYAKCEGWVYIKTEVYNAEVCYGRKPFFSCLSLAFYPIPVIQRYVDYRKNLQ